MPFSASDREVREIFSKYGKVMGVEIRTEKTPDDPKAFGFVDMEAGAEKAIEALNRSSMGDKRLEVRENR